MRDSEWRTVAVACVGLLLAGWAVACSRRAVTVTVTNTDASAVVNELVIGGCGERHSVGGLKPGEQASAQIHGRGECGVELVFSTSPGGVHLPKPIGYIEAGYSGSMQIDVDRTGVAQVKDNVRLGFY